MNANRRSGLVGGVILVVLGVAFLLVQWVPGWGRWLRAEDSWPLIIIAVGAVLLVLAVALSIPPLAIPGCIVGGIGAMLFYQNATGYWESWAFAWTLIPGFVGVGTLLAGLLEGKGRSALGPSAWMIFISLVAFFVFGSFLGFGRLMAFGRLAAYWPVLLVLGGLLILGQGLFRRKS